MMTVRMRPSIMMVQDDIPEDLEAARDQMDDAYISAEKNEGACACPWQLALGCHWI